RKFIRPDDRPALSKHSLAPGCTPLGLGLHSLEPGIGSFPSDLRTFVIRFLQLEVLLTDRRIAATDSRHRRSREDTVRRPGVATWYRRVDRCGIAGGCNVRTEFGYECDIQRVDNENSTQENLDRILPKATGRRAAYRSGDGRPGNSTRCRHYSRH